MGRFGKAIRQIRFRDLASPFVFLLLLVPSWIFRLVNKIKRRTLWLIAEEGDARDNGYHFYKYVREKHPSDYCFYAIKHNSAGYEKVAKLGNVVKWGSLKHWLYYMSANLNISSQKSGNPCPIFWYVVHVNLGLYRNRAFLQHGVIMNDLKWLYYNKTKFKYFITSTLSEYNEVKNKYGYPINSVILAGLPRWDNLDDACKHAKEKSILIMPTWRNWLGGEKNAFFAVKDFQKTEYYKHWNGLLTNNDFIELLNKNNMKAYFYMHVNMCNFADLFTPKTDCIQIVKPDQDIQSFFKNCSLMITDYSSAMFDFAYLKKPIVYYQFDEKEFRERQYSEGYFSYSKDGFGPVVGDIDELINAIIDGLIGKNYKKYLKRIECTFAANAGNYKNNSKAVYDSLINMGTQYAKK